jgi:hypothetical protein
MAKKYNSINDSKKSLIVNNNNVIELLVKLDQALHSNESYVTAKTTDTNGNEVLAQIPTVGNFKAQLDQLTSTIQTMAGLDGSDSLLKIADDSFKKIITVDINKEPNTISQLAPISTFKTDPNWIFDSFLNPLISVEIDLANKINENTRTIISKRYIVSFNKQVTINTDGSETVELTSDAKLRLAEFEKDYKGNNSINIDEFTAWLTLPGLVNNTNEFLIDQDNFVVEPNKLNFKGDFTVLNTELDTVNQKLWYILDTLTYSDISDVNNITSVNLSIGDEVMVNSQSADKSSATIYKVVEISTVTSEFRVRFERVFGIEAIPVRINALSIYSDVLPSRKCRISVGFDEYSVLFVKQLDEYSNIVGNEYSPGIGFYTNELRLDNENGELFSDYYVNTVYDYGAVLQDLVAKKIPNVFGIKPNPPVLDRTNFKVVQINKHLTQTVEAEAIRDKHNKKNNIISEIAQIETAIEKQNKLIATTDFDSNADKKQAEDILTSLLTKLDTRNKTKVTLIQDILASKKNLNKIKPVYHFRGFFPMPETLKNEKTKPQEVVQFEIWYRMLSKSDDENPILTIDDINNISDVAQNKKINAAFSNWKKYKTDVRSRVQDPITGEWTWQIEDVSDANTPNINQIDLPINPGERIELKVKALSEVGWPESPIESEFSNILKYDFPDDLNSVLNDDEFILKEAQADEIRVNLERDLESRGLNLHLSSAIRDVDNYYPHTANVIASGFKRDNGTIISLYDKILELSNTIKELTDQINKAKGILEIYIDDNGNKTKIFNGNKLEFNIQLENYLTKSKIGLASAPVDSINRTYKNDLININNYKILIKNVSTSGNVGILSYRKYSNTGAQSTPFAYNPNNDTITSTNASRQAIWNKNDGELLLHLNQNGAIQSSPKSATQVDNQWIWLQVKDFDGNDIYNNSLISLAVDGWDLTNDNGETTAHQSIISIDKNLGYNYYTSVPTGTQSLPVVNNKKIPALQNWEILESLTANTQVLGGMGSTVTPVITGFNDIRELSSNGVKTIGSGSNNDIIIPLNLFVKAYTGTGTNNGSTPTTELTTLPPISGVTRNVGVGKLEIIVANVNDVSKFVVGDRVILTGMIDAALTGANGKVLTVTGINGSNIITDYDLTSAPTPDPNSNVTLAQLHKMYTKTGSQLKSYNVYGTDVYIKNYVEIVTNGQAPGMDEHTKSLRFYLEDENNIRPIDFQITFNIAQFKESAVTSGGGINA